ncbi:MAG: phenylalanine--tRNA ligase subunit beta [Alphaproteobacteria bacterium]|nr:phenylalanine--tRNA ligase subunit beta [Alphaproteobacteria bacterium]
MKVTLSWLRDHLATTADLSAIAEKLTTIGLEVDSVIDRGAQLRSFVVGQVERCERHPDADKLSVCQVDIGGAKMQVVCGAPNARTGLKGVFAPVGSTLPGTGLLLKASKIRGVESNGMLCSEREMGLSEEHQGIIELPPDAPVGTPFATVMGLDDPVIDINVTPNRQDCLGVLGIARDLAAAGLGTLKTKPPLPVPGLFKSPIGVRLDLASDPSACPFFVGRYVRNVKNGPSPRWLQQRLQAIGLRPISALVDITNYLTFDRARPLHVFDADTVAGGLHVRLTRSGEKLQALDGREYALDDQVTVIADDDGALALGGVIGGESSGCTDTTTNVFIEAALFDPARTAATGRRHGIESDARYRFERGVDPDAVVAGMEAATRLVIELCGGDPSELVIAGKMPDWPRQIRFRPSCVPRLSGLQLGENETAAILEGLGFGVRRADGEWLVAVPSWRRDVEGEADLVEEVARIRGFDAIPLVSLPKATAVTRPAWTPEQLRAPRAKRALAARGLFECVTWSFLPAPQAQLFGGGAAALTLVNPISTDLTTMRPSLLPNLIVAAGRNAARGAADTALFEVGPQYADATPAGQALVAAGVRRGNNGERHWAERQRPVDVFDVKTDVLAALADLGLSADKVQVAAGAAPWYHPGRAGAISQGPKTVLAWFGELHPRVLDALDVKGPLVGFELFLGRLPTGRGRVSRNRGALRASDLQAIERDFAFVVGEHVPAQDLVRAARGVDKALIADVTVFDVFAGASLGAGQKSLAICVRLQPTERTLTDAEIEGLGHKVVAAVTKATGGTLRT